MTTKVVLFSQAPRKFRSQFADCDYYLVMSDVPKSEKELWKAFCEETKIRSYAEFAWESRFTVNGKIVVPGSAVRKFGFANSFVGAPN